MREACLTLQDAHGQSVAFLLWRAWAAAERRAVDARALAQARNLASDWTTQVIAPLRKVRRRLAADHPGIDPAERARLGADAAALEFDAERCLILALERTTPQATDGEGSRLEALREAALAFGDAAPDDLLAKLAGPECMT